MYVISKKGEVNLRYKLRIVRVLGKREKERESVSKSVCLGDVKAKLVKE